jgi:hypothetical protein
MSSTYYVVFLRLVHTILLVSLVCPYMIVTLVFSNFIYQILFVIKN